MSAISPLAAGQCNRPLVAAVRAGAAPPDVAGVKDGDTIGDAAPVTYVALCGSSVVSVGRGDRLSERHAVPRRFWIL